MDNDGTLLSGSGIARVLGVGRNALYAMLRRKQIWDGGNIPREKYRHYFHVKQKEKNGFNVTVVYFRPEAVEWLRPQVYELEPRGLFLQ